MSKYEFDYLTFKILKYLLILLAVICAFGCDDTTIVNNVIIEPHDNSIDSINTFLGTPIKYNRDLGNEIIVIGDVVYSFDVNSRTINWTAFDYSYHWVDKWYRYQGRTQYHLETKYDDNIPLSLQYDVIYGDSIINDHFLYPSPLIPPFARARNYSSINLFTLNVPMRFTENGSQLRPLDAFFDTYRNTVDMHDNRSSQWHTGPIYESNQIAILRGDTVPVPDYVWMSYIMIEWENFVNKDYVILASYALIVYSYTDNLREGAYSLTIDELEEKIGYDLYSNLPDSLESKYESDNYYHYNLKY